jgi:hypothetical protein
MLRHWSESRARPTSAGLRSQRVTADVPSTTRPPMRPRRVIDRRQVSRARAHLGVSERRHGEVWIARSRPEAQGRAAVAVTATFPCPVDKSGSFNVKLGQKVSAGRFAAGSGGVYGPCAGDSTTVTVTVIPTGSLAFKVGAAEVTGSLFACDPSFSCFSFEFAQEVRIHN